jgi:predicted transcriptional regulator
MDWKQVINQLQAGGLSQPQIAARCKCGQATISDLASGKTTDPRHSLGQALQQLLREREKQSRATANGKPSKHSDKPARGKGH